jgi:hypothetical protein
MFLAFSFRWMRLFDFDVHVTCTMDVSINIYKLELYLTGVTFFSLIDINRIEYIQIQFIKYLIKTTLTVYKKNEKKLARSFNFMVKYKDGFISLNNSKFGGYGDGILWMWSK